MGLVLFILLLAVRSQAIDTKAQRARMRAAKGETNTLALSAARPVPRTFCACSLERRSDWLSEGQAFRDAGDYSAAAHAFREALTIAERSSVSDAQLIALDDSPAETYAEAGRFAESEAAYRRALELVDKNEGQASLNYAVLLGSIAVLPTQAVVSEEQIRLLRNAVAVNAREGSAQNWLSSAAAWL